MNTVPEFLKKTAERNGFTRVRFEEKKIPDDFSSICIIPFFGDYEGYVLLSSFLLHRFRSLKKSSKYFIVCGYPNFANLFPYVDEYWAVSDTQQLKSIFDDSNVLDNNNALSGIYFRNLNEFFQDVINVKEFKKLYENGFKQEFLDDYKNIVRFLPFIPSSAVLGKEFNKELLTKPGYKIFLHPSRVIKTWKNGKPHNDIVESVFYKYLIEHLLKKDIVPVIWQNQFTYDLSREFHDKCIFLQDQEITNIFSAMRACGFVLDCFGGVSFLAAMARTPFLSITERNRFNNSKSYEIEDLLTSNIPHQHIFTFASILSKGNVDGWKIELFQHISSKLDAVLPLINRDALPNTTESYEVVLYKHLVRKRQNRNFGLKFIKIDSD